MKHKISELEGALLDAAVAKAEGWEWDRPSDKQMRKAGIVHGCHFRGGYSYAIIAPRPTGGMVFGNAPHWSPSTEWHIGGPIIERKRIAMTSYVNGQWEAFALAPDGIVERMETGQMRGPTPLIAAMRASVASEFGEEVELP